MRLEKYYFLRKLFPPVPSSIQMLYATTKAIKKKISQEGALERKQLLNLF